MRTTLTVDDQLLADLKRLAQTSGRPFKQVVEEASRAGLSALEHPPATPFRLQPGSLGQPAADVDLVKSLALSDALEDDALRDSRASGRSIRW